MKEYPKECPFCHSLPDTVKYKVSAIEANCNIKNRAEITLFKTAAEAEEFCRAVNTNQIGSEI